MSLKSVLLYTRFSYAIVSQLIGLGFLGSIRESLLWLDDQIRDPDWISTPKFHLYWRSSKINVYKTCVKPFSWLRFIAMIRDRTQNKFFIGTNFSGNFTKDWSNNYDFSRTKSSLIILWFSWVSCFFLRKPQTFLPAQIVPLKLTFLCYDTRWYG